MESYNFSNFSNFGDFDFNYSENNSDFSNCNFTNSSDVKGFLYTYDSYKDSVIFELIYKTDSKSFDEKKIEEFLKYGFDKGLSPLETSNIVIGKKLI